MTRASLSKIDWEIEQLALAVDYYEQALHHVRLKSQLKSYNKIINSLNEKIKRLEEERDEQQ